MIKEWKKIKKEKSNSNLINSLKLDFVNSNNINSAKDEGIKNIRYYKSIPNNNTNDSNDEKGKVFLSCKI